MKHHKSVAIIKDTSSGIITRGKRSSQNGSNLLKSVAFYLHMNSISLDLPQSQILDALKSLEIINLSRDPQTQLSTEQSNSMNCLSFQASTTHSDSINGIPMAQMHGSS
jgi:hypothetical protein